MSSAHCAWWGISSLQKIVGNQFKLQMWIFQHLQIHHNYKISIQNASFPHHIQKPSWCYTDGGNKDSKTQRSHLPAERRSANSRRSPCDLSDSLTPETLTPETPETLDSLTLWNSKLKGFFNLPIWNSPSQNSRSETLDLSDLSDLKLTLSLRSETHATDTKHSISTLSPPLKLSCENGSKTGLISAKLERENPVTENHGADRKREPRRQTHGNRTHERSTSDTDWVRDMLVSLGVGHPRHEAVLRLSKGSCDEGCWSVPTVEIFRGETGPGRACSTGGLTQPIQVTVPVCWDASIFRCMRTVGKQRINEELASGFIFIYNFYFFSYWIKKIDT